MDLFTMKVWYGPDLPCPRLVELIEGVYDVLGWDLDLVGDDVPCWGPESVEFSEVPDDARPVLETYLDGFGWPLVVTWEAMA